MTGTGLGREAIAEVGAGLNRRLHLRYGQRGVPGQTAGVVPAGRGRGAHLRCTTLLYDVHAFIAPRQALLSGGTLLDSREWEPISAAAWDDEHDGITLTGR